MPDTFPGMNPYLEHPDIWPTIHPRFVSALANLLQTKMTDRHSAMIQKHVYRVSGEENLVIGHPTRGPSLNSSASINTASSGVRQPIPTYIAVPQTVQESYIKIVDNQLDTTSTIIEVLTPQKKRPGRGRDSYQQHCEAILGSSTHFVEIDLLRGWEPISAYGPSDTDYQVLVSRSDQRPKAELYTWQVQHAIPALTLPMSHPQGDQRTQDCTVDLKQVLNTACEDPELQLSINYARDPIPPLSEESSRWLDNLLRRSGQRSTSRGTNRYDEAKLKKHSAHLQA